jgi:hypothetical protein
LYPILQIRKNDFAPVQSYLSWSRFVQPTDCKLVCVFASSNKRFDGFERGILLPHKMFSGRFPLRNGRVVYLFDLSTYKYDWDLFLRGKYSRLSIGTKQSIRNYFGTDTPEFAYMDTYIFPDKHFNRYSELLYDSDEQNDGLKVLTAVGELCDPFDSARETFKGHVHLFTGNLKVNSW